MTWAQLVTEKLMPALPKRGPFQDVTDGDLLLLIEKLMDLYNELYPSNPIAYTKAQKEQPAQVTNTGAGQIEIGSSGPREPDG